MTFTWFFIDIYSAKLWAEKKEVYQGRLLLELTYKKDFDGNDILKQTKNELEHAKHPNELITSLIKELKGVFPNVKAGDRILAAYTPQGKVTLLLNDNKTLGELTNKKHSQAFLDIWLGPNSSSQDHRLALLGEEK
jgi:hypothetical protein